MMLDQNALDLANRFRMVLSRMARADDFLRDYSLDTSGWQSGVLIITADFGEV